jgi:hypothetical protein
MLVTVCVVARAFQVTDGFANTIADVRRFDASMLESPLDKKGIVRVIFNNENLFVVVHVSLSVPKHRVLLLSVS